MDPKYEKSKYQRQHSKEHQWTKFDGMICCKLCTIVKRADGKNKPCRERVKISLW